MNNYVTLSDRKHVASSEIWNLSGDRNREPSRRLMESRMVAREKLKFENKR